MDPGGDLVVGEEGPALSSVPTTDTSAAASETLLTPGQESVDTLDKGALSPLTGSYLLIVLAEPHSEEDREIIIKRLIKGLRSWDLNSTHVDLSCELLNLGNAAPESDEARNGEKLVQWASENLVVEVLIHCQVNTLLQCMKNLLSSFTRHRHIIHAGYTFQGSGSWILQDGTFSFADFVELWDEPEVHRILAAYRGDISLSLHCAEENGWTDEQLRRESFTKLCQVSTNPGEIITGHSSGIISFVDYISKMVQPASLKEILKSSEIVGNIRFSHPTLYIFPGGNGDAALFGVNGFNMLIDGGFSRHACFWDFTRHLDRLDAVLLTRVNNNSMAGLDSLMDRKRINQVYPQIGHFFGNVMERKRPQAEGVGDKDSSKSSSSGDLLVSLTETGARILDNLKNINLRPQHCFREHAIDPVNLYHKVGHGKLDMYVLNPAKDSREVKEFLSKWNTDCKSFVQARMSVKVEGKESNYPVLNLVSICALLVWQPDNPKEPITRILFPGSTPQQKIFEALGKLKHLEFLKYPICSAKTIAASHKSRAKSERIVSEARAHLRSGETPSDSVKVSRAPSESRVTSSTSTRYSSSLYSGVRSKVTSSQRSDSSTTIQTAEEKDKEKELKGRERSREKKKITTSSTTKDVKDNKVIEEIKKSSSTTTASSKSRTDSGIKSNTTRSRSKSKSKVATKPKVDSGVAKKISPSDVTSPPSTALSGTVTPKEPSSNIKKSGSTNKYGTTNTGRALVSKSSTTVSAPAPATATPPKSAKDATNRKVIEHKGSSSSTTNTVSQRKSVLDKSKESTAKSTVTTSSKPPPAPKAAKSSSTAQRPTTAAASRKPGPMPSSGNANAMPVKRPGTAATKAAAAAATSAAVLGVAAAVAVTTSGGDTEEEVANEEVIGQQEGEEHDKLTVDADDTMDKDSIEEELILKPHTNGVLGLSSSVPVTESSSEFSSLEHVIDYDVEAEAVSERNGHSQSSLPETEVSEVSGSEDVETVESKTDRVAVGPESETHTITEPGGHDGDQDAGYDEEDEYLIVEKEESTGGEEIGGGGKIGNESYYEEKEVLEEKEVAKGESEGEILEEESSIPEVERARKSVDLTEQSHIDHDTHTEEIVKTGSTSEMKDQELPSSLQDDTALDSNEILSNQQETKPQDLGGAEEDDKCPESPCPSPDNKDRLLETPNFENEEGPVSPAPSPDKEKTTEEVQQEEQQRFPPSSFSDLEKEVQDQINNANSVEEISQDITTFEKIMGEATLSKLEEKVESRALTAAASTAPEDDDEVKKEEGEITSVEEFQNKDVTLEKKSDPEKVVETKLDSHEKEEEELEKTGSSSTVTGTESLSVPEEKIVSLSPNEEEKANMCDDKHSEKFTEEEKQTETQNLPLDNSEANQEVDLPAPKDDSMPGDDIKYATTSNADVDNDSAEPKDAAKNDDQSEAQDQGEDRKSISSAENDQKILEDKEKVCVVDTEVEDVDKQSINVDTRDEDKHSVSSLSPARSVEDVVKRDSQDITDSGMLKPNIEKEDDNKHSANIDVKRQSVGSISSAKSEKITTDDDDKHSVKSESSDKHNVDVDKLSVGSVSPARSIEEVCVSELSKPVDSTPQSLLPLDEDDKHSVKSNASSHHEDKHGLASVSPAKSTEEVCTSELSKPVDSTPPSLPLEEDDKHSVKSNSGSHHDDKQSVGSVSPAKSTEEICVSEVSKPVDSMARSLHLEEDDKHSVGSVSPAKSTEEVCVSELSKPVDSTPQSLLLLDDDDKHSVKSNASSHHEDKHDVASVSPAKSNEDLKLLSKPLEDDDKHSLGSVSPAKSIEEVCATELSKPVDSVPQTLLPLEEDDKNSVKSNAGSHQDDKHSVGSVSPAKSTEEIFASELSKPVESMAHSLHLEEDDKHSIKSNASSHHDDKHSVGSVSPAKSTEEVCVSEVSKPVDSMPPSVPLEEDDKHSVKSNASSHHEDKHDVGSVSPAKSIEEVCATELSKPADSMAHSQHLEEDDKHSVGSVSPAKSTEQVCASEESKPVYSLPLEEDDKHSVKSNASSHHDDKHSVGSVSPAKSNEDLKLLSKPVDDDDKHSVKSGASSHHDDKHSIASISPAHSLEELKVDLPEKQQEVITEKSKSPVEHEGEETGITTSKPLTDAENKDSGKSELSSTDKHLTDKLSTGSISPAPSQEDLKEQVQEHVHKPPEEEDDDKDHNSMGSPRPEEPQNKEAISDLPERKLSIASNNEQTDDDKHSIKSSKEEKDRDDDKSSSPSRVVEPESAQLNLAQTDKPDTLQSLQSSKAEPEEGKADLDKSPSKLLTESEQPSEEGRPSSTEMEFDTEILPSEALALVQLGEKLITESRKDEVASLIANSSSSCERAPADDKAVGSTSECNKSEIKDKQQIDSVHPVEEKAQEEGEIACDLLSSSPSIPQQEKTVKSGEAKELITDIPVQEKSPQIEENLQTPSQEKEDANAQETDEPKTEDIIKVPAKSEEQQRVVETPQEKDKSPSAQQQQQRSEQLSLVETDNDAIFSPGDSIRTEELDMALEEHRRRLSQANSQGIDIIMGNMSEDKVDIETSRESQFGSVNEEPDVDDKDWGDEEEQPKLHFNKDDGDGVLGAADDEAQTPILVQQVFKESSLEQHEENNKTSENKEQDSANKQRPVITPSAIPSKFPRESKEVIRTPDEVADLPVHEEVDPGSYKEDQAGETNKVKDGFPSSSSKAFQPDELMTSSAPNTHNMTTATFTTTSITTTHTTKDEESPAPEMDSTPGGVFGSCESDAGKLEFHEKSRDFNQVDQQLPEEQKVEGSAMSMSIVEKIDAAVSPVLESLLTKSVEKSLELNQQQPELARVEDEDKNSTTATATTTTLSTTTAKEKDESGDTLVKGEENEGTIQRDEDQEVQATAKHGSKPITGEEKVGHGAENSDDDDGDDDVQNLEGEQKQLQGAPPPQLSIVMKSTTSVVITPSTPPVFPTTASEQTDSFNYGDGQAEIGQRDESPIISSEDKPGSSDNDNEDNRLSKEEMITVKESVTMTTSSPASHKLFPEEKSDESSTSSALTAIVAPGKSDEAPPVPAIAEHEEPKKLFFLPRDEDDDEDDEEQNDNENLPADQEPDDDHHEGLRGVETEFITPAAVGHSGDVDTIADSFQDVVETKSVSKNTDLHISPQFPSDDKINKISHETVSELDVITTRTPSPPANEDQQNAESGKDKSPLKSDPLITTTSQPETGNTAVLLSEKQHHPECYLDLQHLGECQFHSEEEGLASSQKASIYGSQSETKSPQASSPTRAEETKQVIKQDKEEGEKEERSIPISITSSLLETAQSAVSSAFQTATEALDVAHSTLDEVEKCAVDMADNLLKDEEEIIAEKHFSGSLEQCPKSSCVAGVEDEICNAMKGGLSKKIEGHADEKDENEPGVVEELCVKSVAPKPIVPDHFFVEDSDDAPRVEEGVHLVIRKEVKSEDKTVVELSVRKLDNIDDDDLVAELEGQMVDVEEKNSPQQTPIVPDQASPTPGVEGEKALATGPEHIKSPFLEESESLVDSSSQKHSSSTMQIVEEEQKTVKKRKQLSDYIGTIKEAKAVFENLLKIAKSGATLSSAVDECKENAQEAIRRHLEAAEEVYRPAKKEPEDINVADSPEPEMGITVYESLEQMAKAGVELFSGLVEKVEKEIEEKAKHEGEDEKDNPPENEDGEQDGDGQRRSSAELAVTAALQHLHETFKTMQTLGSSPKRSSSSAARRIRCHHHDHDHHHCSHSQELQQQEDELSSTTTSSAIFSTNSGASPHLSVSGRGGDESTTLKSPDDGSEGETMRESMSLTESGVVSQSDADENISKSHHTVEQVGQEGQKKSDEDSPKSKSEEAATVVMSSSFISGSNFEQEIEKVERFDESSESKKEEVITDSGNNFSKSESTSKSGQIESSEFAKKMSITEEGTKVVVLESKSSSSFQEEKKEEEKACLQQIESSHSATGISSDAAISEFISRKISSSTESGSILTQQSESIKFSEEELKKKVETESSSSHAISSSFKVVDEAEQCLSRYEDSSAQMYKDEFGDGSFRRFSSVDHSSPGGKTSKTGEPDRVGGSTDQATNKLLRSASEAQGSGYCGDNFEFTQDNAGVSCAKKGEYEHESSNAFSDVGYESHIETTEVKDGDGSYSTTTVTRTENPKDGSTTTTTVTRTIISEDLGGSGLTSKSFQSSDDDRLFSSSGGDKEDLLGDSIASSSLASGLAPGEVPATTTTTTTTIKKIESVPGEEGDSALKIEKVTTTTIQNVSSIESAAELLSSLPSDIGKHVFSSSSHAFPQLQEEYSSGDFTDSQPSSIPTQQAETDEDVHNFDIPTSDKTTSSTTTVVTTTADMDNGNFSSTTTTTTTNANQDNGSVTTQRVVTTTSSYTSDNGNLNNSRVEEIRTASSATSESSTATTAAGSEILKDWGKPYGLPVVYTEGENGAGSAGGGGGGTGTPKKSASSTSKTGTPAKTSSSGAKRTSSRKTSRHSPIYVDLAYVPHHGNSHYCDSEFFRMIRSRYYVFSGLEPSREVFEGLLQGKQQWEDKNLETTIIPTYDTDTLGYWVVDSEKELAEAKIDLAPSASRCTINLQDHETSCAAYRLEF